MNKNFIKKRLVFLCLASFLLLPLLVNAAGFGNVTSEWNVLSGGNEGFRSFKYTLVIPGNEEILLFGDFQVDSLVSALGTNNGARASELILRKMDRSGGTLWTKGYTMSEWEPNSAKGIALLGNGDILLSSTFGPQKIGEKSSSLLRVNSSGKLIWGKTIGSKGDELAKVLVSPNGGFLVVGDRHRSGNRYLWIAKLDDNGNYQGESEFRQFRGTNAFYIENGKLLVSVSDNVTKEPMLLTISGSGQLLTSVSLPTNVPDKKYKAIYSYFLPPSDGEIFGVGYYGDFSRKKRKPAILRVYKLAVTGELLWEKTFTTKSVMATLMQPSVLPNGNIVSVSLNLRKFGEDSTYDVLVFNDKGDLLKTIDLEKASVFDTDAFSDGSIVISGFFKTKTTNYKGGRWQDHSKYFVRKMAIN